MNTKCYDRAQDRSGDLRRALYRYFTRDGTVDAQEAGLLMMSDEVCTQNRIVATRSRLVLRVLGGGRMHRSFRCEISDLAKFADELEALGQKESSISLENAA